MEQSIGKQIAIHRKRLQLTQEQLAEKLGVTAQAVSKWETGQSCPDIALLPKLAEIFQISVDELLGKEPKQVFSAEVVTEEDHLQNENSGFEFHWDSGRSGALTFALAVLLFGGLFLLSKIKQWDVSWWSILWPSFLLVYGVKGIFGKSFFFGTGCALVGGYYLLDNLNIWRLNISNELLIPIAVIIFGISLLIDACKKPKSPSFQITRNGIHLDSEKCVRNYCVDEDSFDYSLSFGKEIQRIDMPILKEGEITCSFGSLTVDFSGCEKVTENCKLELDCSFGSLTLLIPRRFRIEANSDTAFGNLKISGTPDPNPQGVIQVESDVSFGETVINYI